MAEQELLGLELAEVPVFRHLAVFYGSIQTQGPNRSEMPVQQSFRPTQQGRPGQPE